MTMYQPNMPASIPPTGTQQEWPEWAADDSEEIAAINVQLADIVMNVKSFGAVGGGVVDDTKAFRAANLYGYERARPSSIQTIPTASMQIYIPHGIYRVKGSKIFGSPLDEGEEGDTPAIKFTVVGDQATILWELETDEDILFFFDGTISMPRVEGLTIIPVSEDQSISIGGTIFKYYNNTSLLGYSDASTGYYRDITVYPGKPADNPSFGTKAKRVFWNTGSGMGDQTLVENCRFNYFETFYRGENQEAVNWTFFRCGFYGGEFTSTVYFDFTAMGDNFSVSNCSFSIGDDETLLKNRSPTSGGFFTQTAHFNFIFRDNRIELIGDPGDSWYMCDINYGRLSMSNTNLRLGGGAGNLLTIVSAYGLANLILENIAFNEVEFRLPMLTTASTIGVASAFGAILRECDLTNGEYTFKYTDGSTVYELKDALIASTPIFRNVRLENCTILNGNRFLDFDIVSTQTTPEIVRRQSRTIVYSQGGVALGKTLPLPPYQSIRNIKLSRLGMLPGTYTQFRIYFGATSLGNYIDVDNPKPSSESKNEFVLWEGIATIFYDDLTLQSITVYVLNSGTETGGVTSQIEVTYEPLDPAVMGISTNSDTIVVRTKSNTINSGSTSDRPATNLYQGRYYYDTTLKMPIWYNTTDSQWKDAAGNNV